MKYLFIAAVVMMFAAAPHVAHAQDSAPADAAAVPAEKPDESKPEQVTNGNESPNPNEARPAGVDKPQELDPRDGQMTTDDVRQQKQDAAQPGDADDKVQKVNPEMNQESDCEGNMINPEKCGWVPCEADKDCAVSGAKCVTQGYHCGGGRSCFGKFCQIPQ